MVMDLAPKTLVARADLRSWLTAKEEEATRDAEARDRLEVEFCDTDLK